MHYRGGDYYKNPSWQFLSTLHKMKIYDGYLFAAGDIIDEWIKRDAGLKE